ELDRKHKEAVQELRQLKAHRPDLQLRVFTGLNSDGNPEARVILQSSTLESMDLDEEIGRERDRLMRAAYPHASGPLDATMVTMSVPRSESDRYDRELHEYL